MRALSIRVKPWRNRQILIGRLIIPIHGEREATPSGEPQLNYNEERNGDICL